LRCTSKENFEEKHPNGAVAGAENKPCQSFGG
jgi:hypothetical protein